MLIIFAQIILGLSILGILIIFLKKIPVILKYPRSSSKYAVNGNIKEQWDKIKETTGVSGFFHNILFPKTEKFLRRVKIIVLKFDNFLARRVDKLRERTKRRKNIE